MTIDEIKRLTYFIVNTVSSGSISPEEFNLVHKSNSIKILNALVGDWKKGLSAKREIGFQNSQTSTDSLSPFFKTQSFVYNPTGVYAVPTDYYDFGALTKIDSLTMESIVEVLSMDAFWNRANSKLIPLDSNPIALFTENKSIKFLPATYGYKIYYIRRPNFGKWGYTVVDGQPVYSAGTSIQDEFPDDIQLDIISLNCQSFGVNLSKQEVEIYSKQQLNNAV